MIALLYILHIDGQYVQIYCSAGSFRSAEQGDQHANLRTFHWPKTNNTKETSRLVVSSRRGWLARNLMVRLDEGV